MSETQSKWFQCKALFLAIDPQSGKEVKMNPTYLVEAVSVTDAEVILTEMLNQLVHDNTFIIQGCVGVKIEDVINNDQFDDWFKCKVSFLALDERSGKEKRISVNILVKGNVLDDALAEVHAYLGTAMFEYEIQGITKSNISEVSKYFLDGKV